MPITLPQPLAGRYSVADFENLPPGPPYYELINGTPTMSPSPIYSHQRLSRDLLIKLHLFVIERDLGEALCAPMDVEFDPENVFQPDIFFIANAQRHIIQEEKKIVGSPDLVMEILSKNKIDDVVKKRYFYEIFGVKEFWLIDLQKKTIEVLENQDMEFIRYSYAKREGEVESKLLPGFKVSLQSLFN
ncbi:MAG: Uma2 family endonuclease [Cytophagaceae bacterium]|nr:Uma2 family endonuclease [Cytophagaceae bacterium]